MNTAHHPGLIISHPSAIYNMEGCVFMSVESKVSFVKELEYRLSPSVTTTDLSIVLSAVSDVLQRYDMALVSSVGEYNADLFDAWMNALAVQNRSEKTIERYKYVVNRMLKDVNVPIRNITIYHLRSWIAKEKARGIADSTLEGQRQIFSSFFGWLWREGLIETNPVFNLGAIKVAKKVREAYKPIDIELLKSTCSSQRDLAIILFLSSTGCRVSEIVGLNRDDINFVSNEVVVLGKGNKERTVFFDDVTSMHLRKYLESRKDDFVPLFIGKRGERLQPGGVRFMLRTLAKKAGIDNVHPHKFRRTFATTMISHGMPIQEVASILGHEKLDTTMRYVVLDKTAVKNSYKRYI